MIRDGDVYVVPQGYHGPSIATPEYPMYFLNVLAGLDAASEGTVIMDGRTVKSCCVLAADVDGSEITTVEGLATADGKLHPVQQAVAEGQAFQCAFCMPGFVMSAVGCLKVNPNPTRDELAHGVSGNLCRCGSYLKIEAAVLDAASSIRASGDT